ncbi:MAG: fatty acid desaturase [Bacteroidetes bacterium]|nr:fatty acid desaturase [Bacteroidota bacterium]
MSTRTDFNYSNESEPHRIRTKKILADHPEVRDLIVKNPSTFIAIVGMVSSMMLLSYLLKDSPWWLVVAVAYLVGAFINHSLFVMIHECSHNLLFKKKSANLVTAIFANLPHILPSAVSFTRYHIKHHSFQGIHELDADLPDRWEANLIGHSFFGKALWLLLFPLFQMRRIFRLKEIKPLDGWIVFNLVVQAAFDVALWYFLGPKAFCFMLFSFFFAVGLHPLGARWIQEHYLTLDDKQETYSYYGGLNAISFNVGYHNEHHDFPSVPWNKLPELKRRASSYYDSLYSHTSWTKLFFRFLFDKNISLYSRVVRNDRGKVTLTDESKPDVEMIKEDVLS